MSACTTSDLLYETDLRLQVGGDNGEEFEIHLNGINQMLLLRGGKQNLGMNGMVKNWLEVCHGPWQDDWEDGAFSTR